MGLDDTHIPQRRTRARATGPTEAWADRFDVGDVIDGRYRVLSSLAAGGMGEVFKVEHVSLRKPFALKVMLSGLDANAELVERFKLEAMAASRIGHPNIIDVSDLGQTPEGVVYFVMELLAGRTLTNLLADEGPQTAARTVELGLQIARALAAAHAHGIVHRDLKPDNVMLVDRAGTTGVVKVLDFGVARVQANDERTSNTSVGRVVGTPAYMAPEQARGAGVDARSDIYALGLVLHELLTGEQTFTGETVHLVMLQQVEAPPPPLPASTPPALVELVMGMLQKRAADRPQTMERVVHSLEELSQTLREPPPSRSTQVALAAFAALVVVVVAAVGLGSLEAETPVVQPPPPVPLAPPRRVVQQPLPAPPSEPVAPRVLSLEEQRRLLAEAQAALKADPRTALDKAERCVREGDENVDCLLMAGKAAGLLRDIPTARRHYLRFMELAPRDHRARKLVARLLSDYFDDQSRH
ncbi:MAG: protein kinase [Archangiaceae bacterium]|nr:protein kinase [Archangiaceae bacterium]